MDNRSDQSQRLDPVTAAKRARQEESRRLVESGEDSLESMFFISREIARTIQLRRRTEDF